MQNLLDLVEALLIDASNLTATSTTRDLKTIKFRVEHEGLSFLTIALPNFGSDFFIAIERGYVASDLFVGWKKRLCLPAFLSGFTTLVFDVNTGRILDEPNTWAILAIRQVSFFFKKIKLPCSTDRNRSALEKYILTDKTLDEAIANLRKEDIDDFLEVSRLVVNNLFYDYDHSSILVHHGPGATADGRKGNSKYIPKGLRIPKGILDLLPIGDGYLFNTEESYNNYKYDVTITDSSCVKVTTVPKTQKTPRVIAMEPTSVLMVQQGIKDYLVDRIEEHELTKGHVNFSDQSINQRLALESSVTKEYATLDLSEASDRVHNELIKLMFDSNPKLLQALQSSRSEFSEVDIDGRKIVIELNKFASMGSALCFPIESLFFFIVLLVSRYKTYKERKQRNLPLTYKLLKKLASRVFVYGDDLIVPTDEVQKVVETLRCFGNVVGLSKSYYNSYFRESCGTDAWKGKDITPIYLRMLPPTTRTEAANLVSNVATANLLSFRGFDNTADVIRRQVERLLGWLPTFRSVEHEGLGWTFGENRVPTRYNPQLQRVEVRTLVPASVNKVDRLNGYPALYKCILSLELRSRGKLPRIQESDSSDKRHLQESVMRYVINLKRRWVPIT